ncbi:MAG: hypothetical protein WB239_15000 [Acidimicrobiia bacterium]
MTLAVILTIASLVVPSALTGDLGNYLERSADAQFSGEQLVTCETPDGPRDSIFEMAQDHGSVVAWSSDPGRPLATAAPGMAATISGDKIEAAAVEGTTSQDGSPLYEVGDRSDLTYLGRPAVQVSVSRKDVERARLTVDTETRALVRVTTLTEDGSVYCDRRMVAFQPGPSPLPASAPTLDVEKTPPLDRAPSQLPAAMEGFRLLDTYPLQEGTLSYYSDGFFSLGVAVTDGPVGFADDAEVVDVAAGTGTYQRSFEAGRVTVTWEAGGVYLTVIGDMPPDLLDSVLKFLPTPVRHGFLGRIWSRLFG